MSLAPFHSVPMWFGNNCMATVDGSEIETAHYLSPFNASPTSYAIVNKTQILANQIVGKCHEELIIVETKAKI